MAVRSGYTSPVTIGAQSVITVPLTIDNNNAYANNDTLTVTFPIAGMSQSDGGTGRIKKMLLHDPAVQSATFELWLFDSNVTSAAINAAHSISDADEAHCIGVIPSGTYFASALNSISVSAALSFPFKCAQGSTTLYGIMVGRTTTPTWTTATAPTLVLYVEQD